MTPLREVLRPAPRCVACTGAAAFKRVRGVWRCRRCVEAIKQAQKRIREAA